MRKASFVLLFCFVVVLSISANAQSNCTYTLEPASQGFPGGGGNGTFNVITQPGCSWTATPSDSWITISAGSSGSGSGNVSFSVGLNFSSNERSGKITVNNQTFFISQNRHCNVGATPGTIPAPSIGRTGSVQVVTSSGVCFYTVISNVPWITITSGERGAGIDGFSYRIDPNNSLMPRTGTITVRISSAEFSTVTVNQGGNCTSSISPSSVNIQPSGARGSVSVTAFPDCAWTAASNVDWITVIEGSAGEGNGVVHYTVDTNLGGERTGTISVGNQILTVTQSPVSCTYTLNPTELTIPPNGGNYSLNITTQPGCAWNANYFSGSLRPISLTFTSPTSGIGSGRLDFTIAPNTSSNFREGDIFVNSYVALRMIQDQNCGDPLFNPNYVDMPREGGQGSFSWTPTSVNCSVLTTRSNDSWITLTGTNSDGRHTFSVAQNNGPARTGTISIILSTRLNTFQKVGTLAVNQAGQQNCTYTVNPTTTFTPAPAATILVNVTTQAGCSWTSTTNVSWISITGNASGTGNGQVTVNVLQNTGPARTGTITIAGQTITVNQGADQSNCTYSLTPNEATISAAGGSASFTINTQTGCDWRAISNNESWLRHTQPTGNGTYQLIYTVDPNTGPARQGTISVSGQTFTVNQAGQVTCTYSINPTNVQVAATIVFTHVTVTTNPGCSWTTVLNVPWLDTLAGGGGVGSGQAAIIALPNPGAPRTGTATIAGQVFTVSQAGVDCTYSISPASVQISPSGTADGFNVTTQTGCDWTATSNVNWITITNATGNGSGRISFTVAANSTGFSRSGSIIVGGQTFNIFQDALPPVEYITASGRVMSRNNKPIRGALVTFLNNRTGEARTVATNQFGYFHFGNIERGQAYNVTITHKRYKFSGINTVAYNTGALIQIFTADLE